MNQQQTYLLSSKNTKQSVLSPLIHTLLLTGLYATSGSLGATNDYSKHDHSKHDYAKYDYATHSSPIAISRDGNYVWSVNPGANSVSVIDTSSDKEIAEIELGDDKEPQSVALTPDGKYAVVANAEANSVSIIRIKHGSDKFYADVVKEITTGAEPWNVVVSPDGRRVFVANSGQDTITVLDLYSKRRSVIGTVKLRDSVCNDPDRTRHFQPRGLAVSKDSHILYVTRFLSFTREGGKQGVDDGKEGIVCRLDIDTHSRYINDYEPVQRIALAPQVTGFKDLRAADTSAFPNQLQSIVIRGDYAYLPNIAASPAGPLRFNVDTQAFVSVITGVNGDEPKDAPDKFLNLHLGARNPEADKTRLFFANVWGIEFTSQSGAGEGYAVAAGSDLLVKVLVDADGKLRFTVDDDTTRYIDLNDPKNPATSGDNAGKNPQGLVIKDGVKAYVTNFVSSNISVVDLKSDSVINSIRTVPLPAPGSAAEVVRVGAEQFFSSRGHYNAKDSKGAPHTVSISERLSSEGWQACASCHFEGLTDGVIWKFETGPRKSIPMSSTWNPQNRGTAGLSDGDQRILNYSAVRDEVEDFSQNARDISGPGRLASAIDCSEPPSAPPDTDPNKSTFDPNHGLILGDVDPSKPPCIINNFNKSNTNRNQITVTLPDSSTEVPAQTAMREWIRFAIRTPNSPLTREDIKGGVSPRRIELGRRYFEEAGCQTCHGGANWTISTKDFVSPPDLARIPTERNPAQVVGNPVGAQFLAEVLRDVETFNLGVEVPEPFLPPRQFGNNIGADEKIGNLAGGVFLDALGFDYNNDGKGNGFNVSSLLGIHASPPYLHNGACETVSCVLEHEPHRTAGTKGEDVLDSKKKRRAVAAFVESIDDKTKPF